MTSREGEGQQRDLLGGAKIQAVHVFLLASVKPLPSSVLEPILDRGNYDPRSAPAFVEGRPVEVRVGIHVQSIANFQLATMVAFLCLSHFNPSPPPASGLRHGHVVSKHQSLQNAIDPSEVAHELARPAVSAKSEHARSNQ